MEMRDLRELTRLIEHALERLRGANSVETQIDCLQEIMQLAGFEAMDIAVVAMERADSAMQRTLQ